MPLELPDAFMAYVGLSTPVVIIDAEYRIVYMNARAEAYWDTACASVRDQRASVALRLEPPDDRSSAEWAQSVVYPALTTGDPFTCRSATRDGRRQTITLCATRFFHADQWYFAMTVVPESSADASSDALTWALRDPLTGLFNRHQWQREFGLRNAKAGAVVFFDLDGLKDLNDLAGHARGDQALVVVGRALVANAPTGALVVRFGGDEFVVALPEDDIRGAAAFADRVLATAASGGVAERLPLPLHLSYGIADFEPGGLGAAVDRADEGLYERKGILLRGSLGGRIVVVTRAGGQVLLPGRDPSGASPGAFATGFGPEFDGYFRQMFARAVEQAREFVEFVQPPAGAAVVEVGAGSGRISFDGGLADCIGSDGQLLLTDASAAQLQSARQRAENLGLQWVRFLVAPVEDLPLASDAADLVLGSTFLHFTDPPAAIRSMARIVRPGGQVALCALVHSGWGSAWEAGLEPIRAALARAGHPFRDVHASQDQLEELFTRSGLVIEKGVVAPEERVEFPSVEVALGVIRQGRLIPLFLRGVPEAEQDGLQEAFEARFRQAIATKGLRAADYTSPSISLLARKRA